jgi:hypothetical protein
MNHHPSSTEAVVLNKVVRPADGTRETGDKPAREIRIPELYRTPTPDRDFQGCMKARA